MLRSTNPPRIQLCFICVLLAGLVNASISTLNGLRTPIIPKDVAPGVVTKSRYDFGSAENLPSLVTTSVFNETAGSKFHPSACWDHPAFFTNIKTRYSVNPKPQFTIDCWTQPILSFVTSESEKSLHFDNEIIWFHNQREDCWLPDYMVQKGASYGENWSLIQGSGQPRIQPRKPQSGWSTKTAESNPWRSQPSGSTQSGAWGTPTQSTGWGTPTSQTGRLPQSLPTGSGPDLSQQSAQGAGSRPSAQPAPRIKEEDDLRFQLRYCPTPAHQVGEFRDYYRGETYCYDCTRLDCDNRKIRHSSSLNINLACHVQGSKVEEDETWWRVKGEDCYIPNQVFDPLLFQGNAPQCPNDRN